MSYYYETLFLLPSTTADSDLKVLEDKLTELVGEAKGSLKTFDKWGRYRLAYAVRKNDTGIYVLSRYVVESTTDFFKAFESYLRVKCTESVLRYVHVSLTEEEYNSPYQRPEPVDVPSDRPRRPERPGRESRQPRGAAVASKITEASAQASAPAPRRAAPAAAPKEAAVEKPAAEQAVEAKPATDSVEG